MSVENRIKEQLTHDIVLYMKGTDIFPQCGFSSKVVALLKDCFEKMGGKDIDVLYVNVLEDDEVREGIKVYGNWPTIPQLYLNGELVGGCDIVSELYDNGELLSMLEQTVSGNV